MSDQDRMNNVLDKGYIKTLGCKNNTNNNELINAKQERGYGTRGTTIRK